MPPRWPPSSASPRSLPADPRRLLGARPRRHRPQARLRAHRLHHDRDRRSCGAGGRLRRAGDARAPPCSTAPAWRRSGGASSAPSMRATSASPTSCPSPFPARALDAAALQRDRRGLPRSPPRHLRPRQSQRAGAARQRAPDGHRRDPAAADPRHDRAGGHRRRSRASARCGSARPASDQRHRLRPPAHAGRADGAGTGGDRVAGVHHSRPAGLAGQDERRRLRAADALLPLPARGERVGERGDGNQRASQDAQHAEPLPAEVRGRDAARKPIPPPSRSSRTASTRSPRRCASSSPRRPIRRS